MLRAVVVSVVVALFASCAGAVPATSPSATGDAPAGRLTVLAASSLTDAFKKAASDFRTANPSVDLTFAFGSSSTLATQITNGAPADVFASADETNMQKVADAKLVDEDATVFASNRLEIAVAPDNPKQIHGLADLARPGTIVVLAAPAVPAGRYAREALAKAHVTLAPASEEVDVRAVLNKVALGEADAGIVYVTDVLSASGKVTGVEIPGGQQIVARYPIAVLKETRNLSAARAFVAYLVSERGQALLAEFGFSRP